MVRSGSLLKLSACQRNPECERVFPQHEYETRIAGNSVEVMHLGPPARVSLNSIGTRASLLGARSYQFLGEAWRLGFLFLQPCRPNPSIERGATKKTVRQRSSIWEATTSAAEQSYPAQIRFFLFLVEAKNTRHTVISGDDDAFDAWSWNT